MLFLKNKEMLELKNINKKLGKFSLNNININVNNGDYFMLLGASGAGKTLLLEIISGIVKPDSGQILFNDTDICDKKIQLRNFGIVYQNQYLFPHLNVYDNIAYPLRNRKISKSLERTEISIIAEQTEISHLLKREIKNLSGGEAQRVAIARALATKPKILLLDEPLSFLDVQLKKGITDLLKRINQNGQTVIHVTHDYKEAFTLSSQISILEKGAVIQSGKIDDVYKLPKSKFIASFFDIKNYFTGNVINKDNKVYFETSNCKLLVSEKIPNDISCVWISTVDIKLITDNNKSDFEELYHGKLIDIEKTHEGYNLVIDIGIQLIVGLTGNICINDYILGKSYEININKLAIRY